MKLYMEGEKSKAICPFCKQTQTTTFKQRDVPLSSKKSMVRDVLVMVCDKCDHIVAVPQQSVPRVKESIHVARHSLETRIPRHLLDVVALACHELGFGPDCSMVVFRYYVQRVSTRPALRLSLVRFARSSEAHGRANARFSAKLNDEMFAKLSEIERKSKLNRADVVKGVIIQMKKDILDDKRADVRKELQGILRLAA